MVRSPAMPRWLGAGDLDREVGETLSEPISACLNLLRNIPNKPCGVVELGVQANGIPERGN